MNLKFRDAQHGAGIDLHVHHGGTQTQPAGGDGIQLLVLAETNLNRQSSHASRQPHAAGGDFDTDADAAGIRARPGKVEFKLRVSVATVIAQQPQTLIGKDQQQIRVAIIVEVRRNHGLDRANFVEAELRGDFLKIPSAEIAPDAQPWTRGDDVQPAVVIVIGQRERSHSPVAQRNDLPFLHSVEDAPQFVGPGHDQIGPKILVQVAHRHCAAGGPISRAVSIGERAAANFREQQRGPAFAGNENIRQIVAIPIVKSQLAQAGCRGSRADVSGALAEIDRLPHEAAEKSQTRAAGSERH